MAKVVIIDDNEIVAKALARIAKRAGRENVFYLGAEGFFNDQRCERCDGLCTERLLSDVMMPGTSGLDIMRRLQDIDCPIPCRALMSGLWTNASIAEAKALGVTAFDKGADYPDILEWLTRK